MNIHYSQCLVLYHRGDGVTENTVGKLPDKERLAVVDGWRIEVKKYIT